MKGIHIIDIENCNKITDVGLSYLKGVRKINITYCNITDNGLSYLKDVRYLILVIVILVTDIGLSHFNKCSRY